MTKMCRIQPIAVKRLEINKFFEKYDVVNGVHDVLSDRYKNQEGFGWTNATFRALVEDNEMSKLASKKGGEHASCRATESEGVKKKRSRNGVQPRRIDEPCVSESGSAGADRFEVVLDANALSAGVRSRGSSLLSHRYMKVTLEGQRK